MLTGSGRPRKACSTCKGQKIRCSGERPCCKRCLRLRHTCTYNSTPSARNKSKPPQVFSSIITNRSSSSTPTAASGGRHVSNNGAVRVESCPYSMPALELGFPVEQLYLGIPRILVSTLVEVYFENVYNANLLLHKKLFLESLAAGTARPHVVLSVCAWGANFYRDANGLATLKGQGFMIEWAKRAGKLVFQEAEDLHEDNIVTFCNLALFWHSQGSWRISYLHKGNACQLLHIIGLGAETMREENSLRSEMRRRRFWACYLMHCHNSEKLLLFEPVADMVNLTLPWPEEDFDAGVSTSPRVTLESAQNNGGIFSELVRVLTFWSSVVSFVKSPETSLGEKFVAIHTLDEKLSEWWRKLQPDFKLTSSNIATVPNDALPNILLINLVYHQSLCALHASIVPLFSWGPGDDSWSTARQLSAQMAFEHACTASTLINAVHATFDRLNAMPSFVAYAAYCGCAIQIPFMWCSNPMVKERAKENVRANVRMIHTMADYWKFAALLKIHVRHLYDIHKRHPTMLEDEPKYSDIKKLTTFKINASHARTSILEYVGILRSKGDGYAGPGEENNDLGIEDDSDRSESQPQSSNTSNHEGLDSIQRSSLNQYQSTYPNFYPAVPPHPSQEEQFPQSRGQQQHQQPNLQYPLTPPHPDLLAAERQTLDIFYPFFDLEMLELFPNGEVPDLSQFESSPLSLDYFEIEGWNDNNNITNEL